MLCIHTSLPKSWRSSTEWEPSKQKCYCLTKRCQLESLMQRKGGWGLKVVWQMQPNLSRYRAMIIKYRMACRASNNNGWLWQSHRNSAPGIKLYTGSLLLLFYAWSVRKLHFVFCPTSRGPASSLPWLCHTVVQNYDSSYSGKESSWERGIGGGMTTSHILDGPSSFDANWHSKIVNMLECC